MSSARCSAASLSCAPLPVFCEPLLSLLPWSSNALYLASPWWYPSVFHHRTVPVSLALVPRSTRSCSLAARNRSRAGGWHIVHEAVLLAICSPLRCVIWSHPCAQDCCCPLEGPHTSGKRSWGPASNARFPELGNQSCVLLGASTMTSLSLIFVLFGLVVCSHCSSKY